MIEKGIRNYKREKEEKMVRKILEDCRSLKKIRRVLVEGKNSSACLINGEDEKFWGREEIKCSGHGFL